MPSNKYHCNKCSHIDDERMVQCDDCDHWFHYDCVGVNSNVADVSWNCELCTSRTPSTNVDYGKTTSTIAGIEANPIAASSPATETVRATLDRHVQFTLPQSTVPTMQHTAATTASISTVPFLAQKTPTYATWPTHEISSRTFSTIGALLTQAAPNFTTATSTQEAPPLPILTPATTYDQRNSSTITPYPRYSEADVQQVQKRFSSSAQSIPFPPTNIENSDNSLTLRNLHLERLEEEMKLQKQYLDNKYKILSQSGEFQSSCGQINMLTMTPTAAQISARQAIPKQLPTFSGDPDEWPLFISSFESSTTVAGFNDTENLVRLQSCLKGKAREMVKNKLLLPSSVPEIIRTLRMCFGRPEHILERAMTKARSMPAIKDKLESLIEFALCVRNICATMEGCHMNVYLHNPFLVKELVDKLPNNLKLNWAMYSKDERVPIVKVFSNWLYQMAEAASTVVSIASSKGSAVVNTHTIVESTDYVHSPRAEQSSLNIKCIVCKGDHKVPQCDKFIKASLDYKWKYVRECNICRQCLGTHRRKCFLNKVCGIDGCTAKHHSLLHKNRTVGQDEKQSVQTNAASSISRNAQVNTHRSSGGENQPYFRIVPINIHSKNKILKTYAFLDEGSAVSLIEKNVFNELELQGECEPLCLRWTANTTRVESDSTRANIEISNSANGHKYELSDVHTVENLNLPAQSLDIHEMIRRYPYLKGLPIQSYKNIRPTVLIGANNWKLAIPLKIREGNRYQPIASKTRLGWTLQGCDYDHGNVFRLNIHTCECKVNTQEQYDELHEAVKEYFSMEAPKSTQLLSANDSRALQILDETTIKVNGRYEVRLMWRDDNVVLPESYTNAYKRSMCLRRKMEKDSALKATIQNQINNLLLKGYARKLLTTELAMPMSKIWYLPIFTVTNLNKPGKVRLVWDAAAKSNGASLNDFLLSGPDLLNPLVEVLLAFRVGRVAICGDIAEMFHRINVRESDMHAQRFLWWDANDNLNNPSIYVMRALTFGVSCAPCIAHFIRNRNAEQFKIEFPRAVEAIQKYHYVDDFIDSEDDELAAIKLAKRVKQIHSEAGFTIRNWSSNSTNLLQQLEEDSALGQNSKEFGSATKIRQTTS